MLLVQVMKVPVAQLRAAADCLTSMDLIFVEQRQRKNFRILLLVMRRDFSDSRREPKHLGLDRYLQPLLLAAVFELLVQELLVELVVWQRVKFSLSREKNLALERAKIQKIKKFHNFSFQKKKHELCS